MITQLLAPLPQAYSFLSPSLPEITVLAFVLLITLAMALVLAMAGTVNSVSSSARKQQDLTLTSKVNRVTETPAYRLTMAFTRRHAASTSLYARTSHPWDGRSSRKGSWFTLLAPVLPSNTQKLT
ncbi:hypothetical protein [Shewanella sp.]|uniref:hypothetical protein n=1 Tax=Shewanella sp. TaxID=50422 RepID=UPI004053A299